MNNLNFVVLTGMVKNIRFNDRGFMFATLRVKDPNPAHTNNDGSPWYYSFQLKIGGLLMDRLKNSLANGDHVVAQGRLDTFTDKTGANRLSVDVQSLQTIDGGDMNHVVIQGRLVADPEVRTTSSGGTMTTARVACSRSYKPRDGEDWKEFTSFISIVAWDDTAKTLSGYKKGQAIWTVGCLTGHSYESRDGEKRYSIEVTASNVFPGGSLKKLSTPIEAKETETEEMPDPDLNIETEEEDLPF